jgi:hypothetical protein
VNHARPRPAPVAVAVLVAVALGALTGCGQASSASSPLAAASKSTPAGLSTSSSPPSPASPGSGPASSSLAATTTVTSRPPAGASAAPGSKPSTVTPSPAAVKSGDPVSTRPAPTPATPGTYRYRQIGSLPGTPSEGALVVAPAAASGTQVWTRLVGGSLRPATTVMLFNAAGSFLVSPSDQVAGVAKAPCTFATPLPWPPWPTTAGRSFTGQASCTGGTVTSYQVAGQVQGSASLSLDGRAVTASIVVNTITVRGSYAGSGINVVLTESDYYAPDLRIPVLTRTHVSGSALGLTVTTDRTDTLESSTPN